MCSHTAEFRFYAELNDLLPADRQRRTFAYTFRGHPSLKDAIEALGVPHTEVDLILVNGKSVGFGQHLGNGDRVAVYPVFESLDISPVARLRDEPLREPKFVLDVHLGKLARLLRLLGFDTLYKNDYADAEIVRTSVQERRIILTRDRGILKRKAVTHGYLVRSTEPEEQAREIVRRLDLSAQVKPLIRCVRCNGLIARVDREAVLPRLPPKVAASTDDFYQCVSCRQVYWPGTHLEGIRATIARILDSTQGGPTTR
jgi:uncharacterized protein with PIN domain